MASQSTINSWLEDLASTILPSTASSTRLSNRRLTDTFRRRIRHHNFARTNQFDVEERFHGLEEKFQIFNREDLSDDLHDLRLELRQHEQRWIPDILDVLLRLSDNPIAKTRATDPPKIGSDTTTLPLLRWQEIEVDDPFDRHDRIWQIPAYSDLSSEEDEIALSTAGTSPTSLKQRLRESHGVAGLEASRLFNSSENLGTNVLQTVSDCENDELTEIRLIRESLFMLQGYPTTIILETSDGVTINPPHSLRGLSNTVLQSLLERLWTIRNHLQVIQTWLQGNSKIDYIQMIKQEFSQTVSNYTRWIGRYLDCLLCSDSVRITSFLSTVDEVEENARYLIPVAAVIREFHNQNATSCLNIPYESACEHWLTGSDAGAQVLLQIFVEALRFYLMPLRMWLLEGKLAVTLQPFFVRIRTKEVQKSQIWHNWFELDLDGLSKPPKFLLPFVKDIFACGKTSAFLGYVAQNPLSEGTDAEALVLDDLIFKIGLLSSDTLDPFPAAFPELLSQCFSTIIRGRTSKLKQSLESFCGLNSTLEALDYVYMRKDGVVMDNIECKVFARIDKCVDTWNDRFLIADMLEEGYSSIEAIDTTSIMVHSIHTSSRSMESRRRTVKILGALAIEYRLPWPLANIISKDSMKTYRRVALHLTQLRRAKYSLERVAYISLQQQPISENISDQKHAQAVNFMLLQVINTLFDHFTTAIIHPMTHDMRIKLHAAPTVDDMVAVHKTHITNLDFACLTVPSLRILRDTLIDLLDMCIRFADLVSSPSSSNMQGRKDSNDFEASSFISAESRRYRRRRRPRDRKGTEDSNIGVEDSSSDEDEEYDDAGEVVGEGYSTFIVLDEETTVIEEIRKLRGLFKRRLEFFVAGLRGVVRNGQAVEEFEVLAARLDGWGI